VETWAVSFYQLHLYQGVMLALFFYICIMLALFIGGNAQELCSSLIRVSSDIYHRREDSVF
jgi:hypothetical protein